MRRLPAATLAQGLGARSFTGWISTPAYWWKQTSSCLKSSPANFWSPCGRRLTHGSIGVFSIVAAACLDNALHGVMYLRQKTDQLLCLLFFEVGKNLIPAGDHDRDPFGMLCLSGFRQHQTDYPPIGRTKVTLYVTDLFETIDQSSSGSRFDADRAGQLSRGRGHAVTDQL